MSNVFWKEFKGWCKAFTKTEKWLLILESILIVIFFAFLVFVIVHLIVCSRLKLEVNPNVTTNDVPLHTKGTQTPQVPKKCTWTPSHKTVPVTKYYINQTRGSGLQSHPSTPTTGSHELAPDQPSHQDQPSTDNNIPQYNSFKYDASDGEEAEADEMYKSLALALVKIRPPRDVTFGCFLTIISEYWTVTAASCIEAIEEVDSLDSFVMLEGYGEAGGGGGRYSVADVQVHPAYAGVNRSHDLAALRAEGRVAARAGDAAQLAAPLDYLLTTIGERFTLLGFGSFRTVDGRRGQSRRLRAVRVFRVPGRWCGGEGGGGGAGGEGGAWSHRHLVPWGAVSRGAAARSRAPVCAGAVLGGGGAGGGGVGGACEYCAGSPLLSGAVLVALMADNPQCAVSCEPTLYVNVADVKDWLDAVISD